MNAERLLAHYEKIADSPDAVGRLRRFILDLAVRGKIVPQDANDEPALELLKRIAKKKAQLVKAGEIRKREESDLEPETDELFIVPETWCWVPAGLSP
jgi:type I restriction enzyme S subunit